MPSIGHLAVGLAAGRLHAGRDGPRLRATALFTGLALLPDLDGLALVFQPGPGSVWRHRGATHSLAVAVAVALLVTAVVGGLGRSRWRMLATALAVAGSHALLDAFTRGAGGPMLFWPFSTEKILFPFAAIPASPLLPRLLTPRGIDVMLRELVLFAPLYAYGLWPRRGGQGRAEVPG
ncbi:MAG TPA: metal-dependent hydrolase [Anaeromyxobacter sp.]|nr:metal-dependent hydrolase [Anaeromyxobacter sp.]